MEKEGNFDHIIQSGQSIPPPWLNNLASLLFHKLKHREEDSEIILSHDGNNLISVSLSRLRFITYSLFTDFNRKGIKPGETVLLASVSGNNELYVVLMFTALSTYGVRVLMPMFMETDEMEDWIDLTSCRKVILPANEISSLNHHEKEKSVVGSIISIAEKMGLRKYDIGDFGLSELLYKDIPEVDYDSDKLVRQSIEKTSLDTEALLITTSGSSGKSKIVIYEQASFILSCMSWQEAGFYDEDMLGGRGFTPLFTHTMGVRAYFNALWTGLPVCLIITEWFEEKPEIVRYFLLKMRPAHITGGPAVYNMLLELVRAFPELKIKLRPFFKAMVSSGAPLRIKTAASFESAFGIRMHNAYGTTETQQAMSTLMYENPDPDQIKTLGLPLPGVKIGLKRLPDQKDLYYLYINSPFGYKGNLTGEEGTYHYEGGFLNTGDIIRLEQGNRIYYYGREARDFFKDGFGVKIPVEEIKFYYSKLYKECKHVEFIPLKTYPGLAAIIFTDFKALPQGKIRDEEVRRKYASLISEINSRLYSSIEPFEYRHRNIQRFVLINSSVPLTFKGTVSRYQLEIEYEDVISALEDPMTYDPAFEEVESSMHMTNTFTRHHNPYVGHMLEGLGIDYTYHRGEKDSLYTWREGNEIEILDFAGGYGTNLLGHNNSQVKEAISGFLNSSEVNLSDQASIQKYPGLLAEKLNLIVGKITGKSFNVLFGSTGSEAVEIALHHAAFEWMKDLDKIRDQQFRKFGSHSGSLLRRVWEENKREISKAVFRVVVLKRAFHGNTSGARALLGNQKKREPFDNLLALDPVFIDETNPGWKKDLDAEIGKSIIQLKKAAWENNELVFEVFEICNFIAAIIEPVTGEGGIKVIDRGIMEYLSTYTFPLIMDEIQCGLGRTGTFLASEGVKADYYLFSKALGGNYEKISAVLIDKKRFRSDFGKYFISTFSNGGMAACAALKALEVIKIDKLPEIAAKKGLRLFKGLKIIKEKYPDVIDGINGRGLMLGIRFADFTEGESFFLRVLQKEELLGYFFSAYLLQKHRIRVLPTLSAPDVLRIEPSAYITDKEIEILLYAIEELADQVSGQNIYELTLGLMYGDPYEDNKGGQPGQGNIYSKIDKPLPNTVEVASILHFAYPTDELRMIEPSLRMASDTGIRILFNRIQRLMQMKPLLLSSRNLFGGRIRLNCFLIPLDSAELERLHRQGKRNKIIDKIQQAVFLAASMGAKVISLGGYNSIISNNGNLLLEPENTKLITGNTLTAAVGLKRLFERIKSDREFRKDNTLAVIGAAGNIGSVITEKLLDQTDLIKKIILIGKSENRIIKMLEGFREEGKLKSEPDIRIATDLSLLKECNIIVTASNTNDPLIFPHHLNKDYTILISDISVPSAVSSDVCKMSNVINIPFASYITLPEDPDFVLSSCSPMGTTFCCVAEAILCGLEEVDIPLRGKIRSEDLEIISKLADKHNLFNQLGDVKSFKTGY